MIAPIVRIYLPVTVITLFQIHIDILDQCAPFAVTESADLATWLRPGSQMPIQQPVCVPLDSCIYLFICQAHFLTFTRLSSTT